MNKKTHHKPSKIEQGVMGKIRNGETKIKPQSYYLMIGTLSFATVVLLGVIAAYFMSVLSLWLRIQVAQGPAYGAKNNLVNLVGSFPWLALLIGLVSLVFLIILVKRNSHLYKVRLVYLIPLIVMAFMLIGFILSFTKLPGLLDGPRRNNPCIESGASCRPASIRHFYYK